MKFKVGDIVRYHPVIGGEHDGIIYHIAISSKESVFIAHLGQRWGIHNTTAAHLSLYRNEGLMKLREMALEFPEISGIRRWVVGAIDRIMEAGDGM